MKPKYINTLLFLLGIFFSSAQTTDNHEYQIKAAFLFNFTQFVEWPVDALPESGTPLVIGILGEDPFGNYLEETVTGEKVNGHPLIIQHYKNIDEIKTCHVLYINETETSKMVEVVINLKEKFILTVSDGNNFIKEGGIVRFVTKDNKIQIQINPEAAKEANLIISSKLLRIAELVSSK